MFIYIAFKYLLKSISSLRNNGDFFSLFQRRNLRSSLGRNLMLGPQPEDKWALHG